MKDKRFWITAGILSALSPHVVLPLTACGLTLWGVGAAIKGIVRGVGKGVGSARDAARRRKQDQEIEQLRQEAERRAEKHADEQRKRDRVRMDCTLLYQLHAPEIGERFSKAMFDEFVRKYLGDDRSPEEVEERAHELRRTIAQHLQMINPPRTLSIEGLAQWYKLTKEQIEEQDVEDRYKNVQLASLNRRYVELVQQLMEDMQP